MVKIKCTYEDCFKHFNDEQAMIRHKIKEPNHAYCKICNVDCKDDMLFFIHQLGSSNHVCCPICALEFKSAGARDAHVSSYHRAATNVECAGCEEKFKSGAALMFHIEQDECSVIGVRDFQMQRAERQIQKDAWEAEVDPFGLTQTARNHNSIINTNAGDDLLEGDQAGRPVQSLNNVSRGPGSLASQAQYPPLAQSQVSTGLNGRPAAQPSILGARTSSNLIDLNEPAKAMSVLNINQQSWGFQQPALQQPQYADDPRIKNWVNSVNSATLPPNENGSDVASPYENKRIPSDLSSPLPASTQALPNQSAPHQHIIRMPAHSIVSTTTQLEVEKYWDPIRQVYGCPTTKCKREFSSEGEFRKHLLSSNHIGGQVTCPSCLKKFATTAAWVAHTESASKKCDIKNSFHYNQVMREITGGVLGTQGFNENGSVNFVAPKIEQWNEDGW
ncbi:hypothetical protein H2200_003153 [Cladophialophora chaetospira]|uniref:C2H2-type domain-containing protein n=1 Tax=Cladophialophora chaetospira TaxID=386627 RepID=A0AA38XH10_9EURO|nr:hypothetical protein H2200_003153 [Cladophialophora chaetospira]